MQRQSDAEFRAMRRVLEALEKLPPDARDRVLSYVNGRVQAEKNAPPQSAPAPTPASQITLPLG